MTQALETRARAMADLARGSILASVEIAAAPERVFRALSSEEIVRWWGSSETYRTTRWTGEVRVGGAWRAEGTGANGESFRVEGTYLEVDPPRRLVQTWRYSWGGGGETTLSYELEPIAGGTRLRLRHEGFPPHSEACSGHATGWERVLGWLTEYLGSAT